MSEEGLPQWESVEAAMEDAEATYIDKPVEYGRVVRPDGRQVFADKKGDEKQIRFTHKELAIMNNATFFHNHPSGNSFSLEDVILAVEANLKEIRIVGMNNSGIIFRHVLIRPVRGFPENLTMRRELITRIRKTYKSIDNRVTMEMLDKIYYGRISDNEAKSEIDHEIIKRLARGFRFKYDRQRLGG